MPGLGASQSTHRGTRAAAFAAGLSVLLTAGLDAAPSDRADMSLGVPQGTAADLSLRPEGAALASALAHYSAAQQFEAAGRIREALEHYVQLLKADPGNPDVAAHTAELAFNYQGREAALKILEEAIRANPGTAAPYLNLARFAATYASDDPFESDRAAKVLSEALAKFPRDAAVYQVAARLYLSRKDRESAVKALEQAIKQPETDPSFWLQTGRAAQEVWPLGQPEVRDENRARVNRFFENAQKNATHGRTEEVEMVVAQYFLLTNQIPQATKVCEKLATGADNIEARKLLYRLYDAQDRKDDARAMLEQIVKDAPADVEQRKLLAGLYEQREQFGLAAEQLEAAIQVGGGDSDDYLRLGEMLLRGQDYEKLIQLSQRSVRLFPEQPMFHVQAAFAHRSLSQFDAAIKRFAEADKLAQASGSDLLNHRFYFQYGVTLERASRWNEASRMFEKSISMTPKDNPEEAANTLNYLGYMWLEQDQNLDKAGEFIRKANELQPDNAAYIDSLGWFHFKKGDYQTALKELLRARDLLKELQPEDAEIVDHIGRTYLKLNDRAKAVEFMEKAAELNPADTGIQERLREAKGLPPKSGPADKDKPAATEDPAPRPSAADKPAGPGQTPPKP